MEMGIKTNNIAIGDSVKVIHNGRTYCMYSELINNNFPTLLSEFYEGYSPEEGTIGRVINTIIHPHERKLLYIVRDENHVFIISEPGIEKYGTYEVNLL